VAGRKKILDKDASRLEAYGLENGGSITVVRQISLEERLALVILVAFSLSLCLCLCLARDRSALKNAGCGWLGGQEARMEEGRRNEVESEARR
jgi:hypothetical protein